jgi:hypothetical protein
MISSWDTERVLALKSLFARQSAEEAEDELEQFLAEDIGSLNRRQRVILIAEEFDWQVLATAEWLNERFGVDISCYRLSMSRDGANEYISCTCIYPSPELSEIARRRSRRSDGSAEIRWKDWEQALDALENQAVVRHFQRELAAGREDYLRKKVLHYRIGGKRRYSMAARKRIAYLWQMGRFGGDEEFWAERIGPDSIRPVKDGRSLRFFLKSDEDFERFRSAIEGPLQQVEFTRIADAEAGESEVQDE